MRPTQSQTHDETCVDHPTGTDGSSAASDAGAGLPERRWTGMRDTAGAVIGTVLGIAPHVLHHIGLVAGAALVTGASGNTLFYAIGLLFSVPMLRRLHRRFSSWWAPVVAVAVFTGLFSISAFVVGPAISEARDPVPTGPTGPTNQAPTKQTTTDQDPGNPSPSPTGDHTDHHR